MPRSQWSSSSPRASLAGHHDQVLTPRTPHSRAGRAEEGGREAEDGNVPEDDGQYATRRDGQAHQSVPLLRSSASDFFPHTTGYQSQRDNYHGPAHDKRPWTKGRVILSFEMILSRVPLVMGSIFAAFLLFLTIVSYIRPDKLHSYFGVSGNATQTKTTVSHHRNLTLPTHIITYENYTHFPLRPLKYRAECVKNMLGFMSHGGYWDTPVMGTADVLHVDEQEDYVEKASEPPICSKTLTYMLNSEVGLFADLALLAQAAAVAHERNRTLLIDDTYWNRGRWTDYFVDIRTTQPGPEPGCRVPPPNELVACPRLARHWVINSRTARFHFGHGYSENYEDAYAHDLNRLKPIYNAAQYSFQNAIQPNERMLSLITAARSELAVLVSPVDTSRLQLYTSLHIRLGDRKPAFFRGPYVPTEMFIQAAVDTWHRLHRGRNEDELIVYVASDSPEAYTKVQQLLDGRVTTLSLFDMKNTKLRGLASPKEYVQAEFGQLDQNSRARATAGVIVDFSLLGGFWSAKDDLIPDATVCTISSNICKLAAVGLGWERAFGNVDSMGSLDAERKRWIEIDQNGVIVPAWEAFELF